MSPKTFTVFCQEDNGKGTIWIGTITLENYNWEDPPLDLITEKAIEQCADEWSYDDEEAKHIVCMGIAEGDVTILMWDDTHLE